MRTDYTENVLQNYQTFIEKWAIKLAKFPNNQCKEIDIVS